MTAAVVVDEISKRYTLGSGGGYRRLTEVLTDRMRRPGRGESTRDEFWALKDVSFEVPQGEVIGIIGRNGAGKSTLLKILSRITEPTSGRAVLHGRVGSLLEVGTGFHPELSGRENIFLNGAVLGMRRAEIARRFDEIVEFAEIDRFLDTPVKRYSSGMYVRLAFAIAAHLEPEILIVDEVLAVGDAAFQKKCLGKMGDVAESGRTVLFVSHNMAAVRSLCSRGLMLDHGRLIEIGPIARVLDRYAGTVETIQSTDLADRVDREGDGRARAQSVSVSAGASGEVVGSLVCGLPGTVRVEILAKHTIPDMRVSLAIRNEQQESVLNLDSALSGDHLSVQLGTSTLECRLVPVPLMPGRYLLNVYLEASGVIVDWIQEAAIIDIDAGDFYGTGRLPPPGYGSVLVPFHWTRAGETRSSEAGL
jgi:lipopolysaccharide transport system ATP-binding protein